MIGSFTYSSGHCDVVGGINGSTSFSLEVPTPRQARCQPSEPRSADQTHLADARKPSRFSRLPQGLEASSLMTCRGSLPSRDLALIDSSNTNDYHYYMPAISFMLRRSMVNAAFLLGLAAPAVADDLKEYQLILKDHAYQPSELKVPAGVKFKITVRNEDATPEEFESTDFNREKIIPPHTSVTVYVGPLNAGSYGFFGDFHQHTAKGRLIAE